MFENSGLDFWFAFIFFGFLAMLPLGIWKIVDIAIWIMSHVSVQLK